MEPSISPIRFWFLTTFRLKISFLWKLFWFFDENLVVCFVVVFLPTKKGARGFGCSFVYFKIFFFWRCWFLSIFFFPFIYRLFKSWLPVSIISSFTISWSRSWSWPASLSSIIIPASRLLSLLPVTSVFECFRLVFALVIYRSCHLN